MAARDFGQRSYTLVMSDGSRKEFSASDAAEALNVARGVLPLGRSASLLEDGIVLAEIDYAPEGFWQVSKRSGEANERA